MPYNPAMPLLGINPGELRTGFARKLVHRVHGVAVLVVKRQRPSERPGTEEQIKCSTFVCHNVIRPREVTGTLTLPDRVDVADVTPRESSPARKPTWCVIICETARGVNPSDRKQIRVCRWGRGGRLEHGSSGSPRPPPG